MNLIFTQELNQILVNDGNCFSNRRRQATPEFSEQLMLVFGERYKRSEIGKLGMVERVAVDKVPGRDIFRVGKSRHGDFSVQVEKLLWGRNHASQNCMQCEGDFSDGQKWSLRAEPERIDEKGTKGEALGLGNDKGRAKVGVGSICEDYRVTEVEEGSKLSRDQSLG